MLVFTAVTALPALAAPAAPPALPAPKILVIDRGAILQFSKVGQDIARQVQGYANQAKNDMAASSSLRRRWHESKWCFVEFAQARALGKAIFPIVLAPDATRYVAPDIQQLDFQVDREGGLNRLKRELSRLALDAQGGFDWDRRRPPYPGLMSFDEEDAAIFFGRDDDVRAIIERLNASRVRGGARVLALLGASGSGKSSVMRAGVLPRLKRDKRNWIVIPPFRPGRRPIELLARAICEALGTPDASSNWTQRLREQGATIFADELDNSLRVAANAREAQIFLMVDQGEELFTLTPADEREKFLALLAGVTTEQSRFISLLALRSDYLDKLQETAGLLPFEEISLGPFPLARVRAIIQGPARVAGISVQPEFVDRALADMGTDDALPLLAFTLRELYDEVSARRANENQPLDISLATYLALSQGVPDMNPLESAIQKRARQVLANLNLEKADLSSLRDAFVSWMVRIDAEGAYARKRADWSDIPERAKPILEKFAEARLCVIAMENDKKTVEVSHEAFLRKWDLLRSWLDARKDFLIGRIQLGYSLKNWTEAGADKDAELLNEPLLSRAKQWLHETPGSLSREERKFIEASEGYRNAQMRRAAWNFWLLRGLAAGAAVIIALLWSSNQQRNDATRKATAASLAIQARSNLQTDPARALDLAVQSVQTFASAETQSALLSSVLGISPNLLSIRNVQTPGARITFSEDLLQCFLAKWKATTNMCPSGAFRIMIRRMPATGKAGTRLLRPGIATHRVDALK